MRINGFIFTTGHKEGPDACQVLQKFVKHKGTKSSKPCLPRSSCDSRALLTGKALSRPRHKQRWMDRRGEFSSLSSLPSCSRLLITASESQERSARDNPVPKG